jgi:CBS-domain-containing membrane protein
MRIFEEDFRAHWKNFVFQPLGGALLIGLLEFFATSLVNFPIIACFGATMFIITTTPQSKGARARNLIGGYLCAIASGLLNVFLASRLPHINTAVFAGFAVGLAIFLTCCFSVEHPPAGALAFGLVLSARPLLAAPASLCGIAATAAVLRFARPIMRNLI